MAVVQISFTHNSLLWKLLCKLIADFIVTFTFLEIQMDKTWANVVLQISFKCNIFSIIIIALKSWLH